jgi:cytochrome c-type biogenesis protein CcmH
LHRRLATTRPFHLVLTMPLFWILAALLIAATLGALTWQLLRARADAHAPDAEGAAVAVLRDAKRTLDLEHDAGTITPQERDAAVAELTRRVAEDTRGGAMPGAPVRSKRAWALAIAIVVVVPTTAILLYQRLGNPGATLAASAAAGHDVTEQQIIAMVDALALRLKQRPDDADGWVLLGRSYQTLERFPEAADAYAHANALVKDDPNLLADQADVLAMTQNRTLAGKPMALVDRALALDPRHKKALALAGTAALEARDFGRALGYWRRLAGELPAGSDEARQVADVIAEIESAQRDGKSAPAASGSQRAPRPAQAAAAPAPGAATKPAAGAVSGRVDITPALAAKVALSDTVFIYARAAEGPRMPLAVLRIPARELPRDFLLDDSMGMAPGATLSAAPSVVVEARISKTGNAIPQPGDLYGRSAVLKPGAAGLRITIDQVVP